MNGGAAAASNDWSAEEIMGGRRFCQHTLRSWLWLNQNMFARKVRVEYEDKGRRIPCPLKWLDSFSMRNFTNATVFDDTLPTSDGQMEIGSAVPVDQLKEAMEDWFRRKSYLPKDSHLVLVEN